MHIPDNYLSPSTCAVLGAAMVPVWTRTAKKVKEEVTKVKMPLLGIGAAFSFLIMMFNLPLPGGTTGHAVGAVLIALLLGPYSAVISVTIALLIQAVFFGDGGILAFGANTFNMAFVMPFLGYYIYKAIRGKDGKRDYMAAFIAGYFGVVVASFVAAIEFGIQPLLFKDALGKAIYCPYPLSVSIPAMVIPHMVLVGFIEGIFTAGVLAFVKKVSPEMLYEGVEVKKASTPLYGLVISMIALCPLGLLAAGTAWGEWGADEIKEIAGFIPRAMENGFSFNAPIPDYAPTFLGEGPAGYILSAVTGVLILLILFKLIGKFLIRKSE